MSNRRRYDDRDSYGDRPRQRSSHGRGWSFSTIVIVVGLALLWFNAQKNDGSSTPAPSTTQCTQYFTAGCPGGTWAP